jgi:hypothetical protein
LFVLLYWLEHIAGDLMLEKCWNEGSRKWDGESDEIIALKDVLVSREVKINRKDINFFHSCGAAVFPGESKVQLAVEYQNAGDGEA